MTTIAALTRRLTARLPLPVPVLLLIAAAPLLVGFDFGTSSCGPVLDLLSLPDGRELCTHGADPAPGTTDANGGGSDTFAGAGVPGEAVPAASAQCYGDGRDGQRVQVVYAYETGASNRIRTLDADVRRWTGQAEWTVTASAAETGGRRHIRFVTTAGDGRCALDIATLRLPVGSFDTFNATLSALADAGYDRSDRKYLVFADVDLGFCGLGTVPNDDRKVADNRANVAVGYARVDADCWDSGDRGFYSVAAHELVHTFGGVQASAPNATDGRHCVDEFDAMCYADGAGVTTTTVCRDDDPDTVGDRDEHNRLLDCGNDDYFHTSPAPTSYLGRYWNTADSVYLSDRTSTGAGAVEPRRDVATDPQGRPTAWSGDLGGATRPLLADAYGWEACDLPITVRVDDAVASTSTLGVLGSGSSDGPLRTSVISAVRAINDAVGTTVLTVGSAVWDGAGLAEGELGVRLGATTGRHQVDVTTRAARIRSAVLTLDGDLGSAAASTRDLFALQGLVRTLGVGLTDTLGDLTSRTPSTSGSRTVAFAALRHLYATACSQDARLDDTVAGSLTQRVAAGTRERVDLARTAGTPIAAAVDIAAWLTEQKGDRWASRAIVCRDDVHADCLAGTALARESGPIVFVPGGADGSLPTSVRDVLVDALAPGAEVHVLGGSAAVSDRIVGQLQDALPGRRIGRLAGENRYATAVAVAHAVKADGGSTSKALLARADDPADAVAAGAAAAELGVPILLTATATLPVATEQALHDLGTRTVLIAGGHAAVSAHVEATVTGRGLAVSRLTGRDRFETAVAIARAPALWNRTEVVRSGSLVALNGKHRQTWNLALAAAPVGALLDAPVVFTTADALPSRSADGGNAGGTLEHLRDIEVSGAAPAVTTVFVGAGTWASATTAEQFHAQAVPGFGGNVSVARR